MLLKQYFKFRALFFFQAVIYLKMEAAQNELTRGEGPPKVFRRITRLRRNCQHPGSGSEAPQTAMSLTGAHLIQTLETDAWEVTTTIFLLRFIFLGAGDVGGLFL